VTPRLTTAIGARSTPGDTHSDRQNLPVAIAYIVAAAILIPISDAFAKQLTSSLASAQVAWLRYAAQTAFLLPFVLWRFGLAAFVPRNPMAQAIRGVLIAIIVLCFFASLSRIPLADTVAVFFVNPFVITALSPLFLGERVGVWRWSAVAAGFAGTLLIVRPGFATVELGTLYALAAGCFYAVFVLVTRRIAGQDPALKTTFLTGLGATIVIGMVAPFVWAPVEAVHVPNIVLMGLLGTGFSLFVIFAYERAAASQLAPFGYVEIVAAALIGWIAFADFPDAVSWMGITVITGSGLVIAWRERGRRSRRAAK